MTTDTVLTGEVIEEISRAISAVLSEDNITFRDGDLIWNQSLARAIEQAVLQSPEVRRLREMAEFGKIALRFDKRARWHDEDDTAEAVCNEFARAMSAAFDEIVKAEKQP